MAGIVKSVQTVDVTILAGQTSGSANFATPVTNFSHCVPFFTKKATADAGLADGDWSPLAPDVQLVAGSPDSVQVSVASTGAAMAFKVTIVEFEPSVIGVHTGTFTIADTAISSGAVAIGGTVDLAATFMVFGNTVTSTGAAQNVACAGKFNSSTEVIFDRIGTAGVISGHWWTVESLSGDFSVQAKSFSKLGTSLTATIGITSIDVDKTCIFGSFSTTNSGGTTRPPSEYTSVVELTSPVLVTATGQSTLASDTQYEIFVVTFNTATSKVVWRGLHNYTDVGGDSASQGIVLSAPSIPTLSFAMCSIPVSQGLSNASTNSGNSYNGPYACQYMLEFVDSSNILATHAVGDSGQNLNMSWEVIQWEEYVAAPGPTGARVMVRMP